MDVIEQRKRAYFGREFTLQLNKWMKERKKTQKDFCSESGVSKNMITAWKRGDHFPREDQMIKICKTFGVDQRVFYPVLPFEQDRITNSLTEERSRQLQQYAEEKGLKDEFYQFISRRSDFLRKFPIHRRDWFSNSQSTDITEGDRFDLVKYQIEDDFGHRFMMTEEDIDFLIRVQDKTETQIDFLMYRERQKIDRKRVEHIVDLHLKHLKIDRAEVLRRLFAVDLTQDDRRISEKMIGDVVLQMAKEQGVKPHYTIQDVIDMYPKDDPEYIRMMNEADRLHGMSEDQIGKGNLKAEEQRREVIRQAIENFRAKGFLIEDDNTETEG